MADLSAQPNGHKAAAASNGEAGQPATPSQAAVRRDILPIPDVKHVGLTTYDAKDPDTTYPPITTLRPPEGAPNVLIVLLDDVGFGGSSAFGGPCNTPTAERLAAGGLKLNRFHTTALCSPTRQALLTGRNHHSVGMGGITEIATSAPGNSSVRPKEKAPIAETLVLNGYSTAQFGKCHEVPVWEVSPVGPFHQWPTGSGFEYFYGFVGGEANQYYPGLYEGTAPVEPPKTPEEGYTLTEDLADRAITWVRQQKALMPDKPFFMYFAPGATHAPHHVPKEWSDKYQGKFDDGWDTLREQIVARQKELGVVPKDAELTAAARRDPRLGRHARRAQAGAGPRDGDLRGLPRADRPRGGPPRRHPRRPRGARRHAGLLHHRRQRRLGRGHPERLVQRDGHAQRHAGDRDDRVPAVQDRRFRHAEGLQPLRGGLGARVCARRISGPSRWPRTGAAPATARSCTGPTASPTRAQIRNQFHHVIDVAKTILEAAGLPEPIVGERHRPGAAGGREHAAHAARRRLRPRHHDVQYFEMLGNRGIYHKGWTAVTKHRTPWTTEAPPPFDDDVWELYGPDDWTQAHNLAAENPEKLAEMQRLWLIEAVKYNVVPLDDRTFERFNPDLAGRPQLIRGNSQLLFPGMRVSEACVLTLKNKSHSVTANITVPDSGAAGVIITQGGQVGGWSLYAHEGKLKYCYNFLGVELYMVTADEPDPGRKAPGAHGVRLRRRRARPRAATSRCTTTANPSARAGSNRPSR